MPDLGRVAAGFGDTSAACIQCVETIPASPAAVWRAWTDAARLSEWLTEAHIELSVGGAFEIYFMPADAPERGSEGCKVLSYVPERMLSFTWNGPPHLPVARPQHTYVVLFFSPTDGGGTRVELNHLGWPASGLAADGEWPQVFSYFEGAWPKVMAALKGAFSAADKGS